VAELNGVSFSGKKDLRNLMLQYGDASTPFKKSFPSIGLKEMFYDPIKDTIVQNPLSVQL
jgi:NADH:ubiquinone oxidoreductase subunit C